MARNVLYLINPAAGTRSKEGLETFLKNRSAAAGLNYTFLHTTKEMDAASLLQKAEEFGADDLVVCGGDGTLNLAAKALQNSHINLGIIPVGSGNGLGRCAGIPMKPSKAFEVILKGNVQTIDAFLVNGHFSCMLSGIGLDAAVAEKFATSQRRGLYTYAKESLIQFFKATPYHFEIELPSLSFDTDAFFISIANSNQFGNNVTIAPKASLCDGLLDVVIVKKMSKAGMLFAVLNQLRNNNDLEQFTNIASKKNILYFQTPTISIHNLQGAPLHIDGDPCTSAKHISIKVLPGAFRLLVP